MFDEQKLIKEADELMRAEIIRKRQKNFFGMCSMNVKLDPMVDTHTIYIEQRLYAETYVAKRRELCA